MPACACAKSRAAQCRSSARKSAWAATSRACLSCMMVAGPSCRTTSPSKRPQPPYPGGPSCCPCSSHRQGTRHGPQFDKSFFHLHPPGPRDIQAQVRTLWLRLDSLRGRVQRLSDSVLPSLNENQRLSTTSYRAGEIGLLQLLVVNRQLVDARRDYLDALAEFVQTRIALEQAAGEPNNAGAK